MKGRLKKIEDKWVVEYSKVKYVGGNPKVLGSYTKKMMIKTLPLTPKNQEYMNCFLYVDSNTEVDFKEVLVNPMGREVDHTNLGQNHSGCVWYAELTYDEDCVKEEQKQHLIDMMESDEELGLYDDNFDSALDSFKKTLNKKYDEPQEIKFEDVFNDEKREKVKEVIHQHKVLKDLSLVNPAHLQMNSNGHGEFPDGYKLTEKGIQYIIEQLNNPQEKKMYSEQEVRDLLETQRGNCYVAILSQTKNDEIASIAIQSPEPGGKNGTWVK